jgi:hypothetical protein
MDFLVCNCASKLATLSRPGMTIKRKPRELPSQPLRRTGDENGFFTDVE